MSRPPSCVLQHRGLEALALALLAGGGDAGHHGQVGVDDAGAVAGGAGALGVGAEQRRLDAVGLGERLADRVEQAGVGRRVAAPGAADRAWSIDTTPRGRRPNHGPASSCPSPRRRSPRPARRAGCRRRRRAGCWWSRRGSPARRMASRTVAFSAARSSRWRPVSVSPARSPSTLPSKQTSPPAEPAPGPRSTTWSAIAITSGLCSTTSTVLPLSRSCSSRSFMRWMSCGCRPIVGSSKT